MMSLKRASPEDDVKTEHSDDDSMEDSQDGDVHLCNNGPPMRKKRHVEFESIRMLSVTGVADIENQATRVKLYKLSERFRLKERQLNEEKKKNEALKLRQDRDDNILCTINRYWNRLDEEMRLLLSRTDGTVEVKKEEPDCDVKEWSNREFLAELAENEGEEGDALCDKRVKSSLLLVNQMMDMYRRLAEKQKEVARILEKSAGVENGDDKKNAVSETCELLQTTSELVRLSQANEKLTKQADKLQLQNREVSLKVAKLEDTVSLQETKIEELHRALEDKDFELSKAWAREEKLDYRLYKLAKNHSEGDLAPEKKTNGTAKGAPEPASAVNVSSKELCDLQAELEQQRELASARLEEIKEITSRNEQLAADLVTLNLEKNNSIGIIEETEEYENLKMMYNVLYEQYSTVVKESEIAKAVAQIQERKNADLVSAMAKDDQATLARQRQQIGELEQELNKVRGGYEMLRIEFEQTLAKTNQQNKVNDMKTLSKSLQTQNYTLKNEVAKFKKKWQEAVSSQHQVQRHLEKEQKSRDQCILIRVEEDEHSELASPDHHTKEDGEEGSSPENEQPPHPIDPDMLSYVRRLQSRIDELKARLYSHTNVDNEKRDIIDIMSRERRLRLENERLIVTVKKIGSADRKEKMKFYSEDAARRIQQLEEQNSRLRSDAESAKAEEEAMMTEMESTGQAFEELQEQNAKLLIQLKEKEEQNLKLLSDRIMSSQMEAKFKEEKALMIDKEANLENLIAAQAQEIQLFKDLQKRHTDIVTKKHDELKDTHTQLATVHRNLLEQQRLNLDLRTRAEKLNAQLKEAQEAVKTKTRAHEQDAYQIRRMEEERSNLKKKYERAKKTEQMGSTDLVLMEEIKDLKESLTCPSCKVQRKDAVLTKCFHVFCMKCLKTRYDTRRRKCPKCNAAFGANDFHRLYFA